MNTNHSILALPGLLLLPVAWAHASTVFVNELHYDNAGSDVGEGVELAGSAGVDLAGWQIVLYNGSDGGSYSTTALDGLIDDEGQGFGAAFFAIPGLQNGPDGVALVDANGGLVQFLSYEGSFVALDGPAAGLASTDIGVFEDSATPEGWSLQLTGQGMFAEDFVWALPSAASYGSLNAGQVLAAIPLPAALPMLLGGLALLGSLRTRART